MADAKKKTKTKADRRALIFGKTAVDLGLITDDQLKECLAAQKKARAEGKNVQLGQVFVKAGLLNEAQVKMVVEQAKKAAAEARKVAGYDVKSEIGRGGMGIVYRARQLSLERDVALKLIPRDRLSDNARKRFLSEAQAAARLNHENIVQAIDAGETDNHVFFAMELFEGRNLLGLLNEKGRFPEAQVCEIGLSMAKALEHAHANKMVHRDIKPQNILMDDEGRVKLTDMGLAKSTEDDPAADASGGAVVGTPHYISPEQIRALPDVDIRTDIYSLGATLYDLITGTRPFDAPKPVLVIQKHLKEKLTPPVERYNGISAEMNRIIVKCMEKKRDKRYQKPSELKEDLLRLRNLGPVEAAKHTGAKLPPGVKSTAPKIAPRRSSAPAAKSNTGLMAAGIGGAAVVLIVVVAIALSGSSDPKPKPTPDEPDKPVVDEPADPDPEPRNVPGMDEFKAIQSWGEEHPDEFDEVIRRLSALRRKHPQSKMVSLCRDAVKAWETRKKEASLDAMNVLRDEADRLAAGGRYGDAIEKVRSFPASLGTGDFKVQLDALSADLLRRCQVDARARAAEAAKAAAEGRFEDAVASLKSIETMGVPSVWAAYKERLEEMAEARFRSRHLAEHLKVLAEIKDKGLDAGVALLAKIAASDVSAEVKDLLREDSLNLDWARGVATKLRTEFLSLRKRDVSVLLRTGEAVAGEVGKVEKGTVSCKTRHKGTSTFSLVDLRSADVARFVSRGGALRPFRLACYCWYRLADPWAAHTFLCRLDPKRREVRRLAKVVNLAVEQELLATLAEADKLAAAARPNEARVHLARLCAGFRGLAPYFRHEGRILDLLARVNRVLGRPVLAEALLPGLVDWPGTRKLRITCDFSNPVHAAGFSLRGGDWTAGEGFLAQAARDRGQVEAVLPVAFRSCTLLMEADLGPHPFRGVGFNVLEQDDGRRLAFDLRRREGDVAGAFFFKEDAAMPFMRALGPWKELAGAAKAGEGFVKILLITTQAELRGMVGGMGAEVLRADASTWSSREAEGFQRYGAGRVGIRACSPLVVRKFEVVGDPDDAAAGRLRALEAVVRALAEGKAVSLSQAGLDRAWITEAGTFEVSPPGLLCHEPGGVLAMPGLSAALYGRSYALTLELVAGTGAVFARIPAGIRGSTWLFRPSGSPEPPGVSSKEYPLCLQKPAAKGSRLTLRWEVRPDRIAFAKGGEEGMTVASAKLAPSYRAGPPGFAPAVGFFGAGWKLLDAKIEPLQ